MEGVQNYNHLKHYFFHLNSPYAWGIGMENATKGKLFAEFEEILDLTGLEVVQKSNPKSTGGACPIAWGGENYLYCHPMSISGYLTEEMFEKTKQVIENFQSNIFSVRSIEQHDVKPYGVKDIQRNLEEYKKRIKDSSQQE